MKKFLPLLSLLLLSNTAFAATYYVKNGGSNAANGLTDGTAWETLTYASGQLSSGDILYLNKGDTWTGVAESGGENGLIYLNNKSNITIDAYGSGADPIINRTSETDPSPDELYPDYSCVEIRGTSTGNTIKNLDMRGGGDTACLYINAGALNTVEDCSFMGSGWDAGTLCSIRTRTIFNDCAFDQITGNTSTYSKSIEFRYEDYSEVHGCTFYGYSTGGAVRFSNSADSGVIDSNFFYHPDTRDDWAWAIVVRSQYGGTCYIYNNVIDMTNHGSFSSETDLRAMAFWDDHDATTRYIVNNTIVSEDTDGAFVNGAGDTTYVYNNIVIGVRTGYNNDNSGVHLINNIFHDCTNITENGMEGTNVGTVTTDPHLFNESMSNHLATDADLTIDSVNSIDTGYGTAGSGGIPDDDYLGGIRYDGSVDIGAFEYEAGPPVTSTSSTTTSTPVTTTSSTTSTSTASTSTSTTTTTVPGTTTIQVSISGSNISGGVSIQ